jgi:hypothetical protein
MAAYDTGNMILSLEAFYGISTFHRKQLPSYLKTTTDAQQWEMLRNQLHVLVTSTSSIFHSANGSSATLCSWNVSILLSTCRTI